MAAATRPGPADARVPCPLCGGLIHPIAGRCKHCKGDLREYRSTRPAAGATLPALNLPSPATNGTGANHGHAGPAGALNGHGNGHGAATNGYHAPRAQQQQQQQSLAEAFAAAAPIPLPARPGPAEAVPILPPRPTGNYAAPAPRASWKSWPVIVIILAVIAIVAAVVLMLFPPGGSAAKDEGTNHSLQPAPDRMDTNPAPATPRQPPSTDPDPWSRGGGGGTAPTKPPSAQAAPDDPDIDDPDVDDALTSRDPFSRRGGGAGGIGGLGGFASPRAGMLYSIIKHACTRLASCNVTSPQTRALCDVYARVPATTPSCAAATRCLRSIDDLSCDALGNDASALWQLKDKLDECADAMSC